MEHMQEQIDQTMAVYEANEADYPSKLTPWIAMICLALATITGAGIPLGIAIFLASFNH